MAGSAKPRTWRPASEGLYALSLLGLAAALAVLCLATAWNWPVFARGLLAILVYSTPQLAYMLHDRWPSIRDHVNLDIDRVVIKKLLALGLALGLIWSAFKLLAMLGLERYEPARVLLELTFPSLVLLALPYLCLVNQITGGDKDDAYHMGNLLLDRSDPINWRSIGDFFKAWFIKAFFFPLMFWELLASTVYLERSLTSDAIDFSYVYNLMVASIYFMDVCIASAGYLTTLRLFGWHIRSSNPHLGAWIFTLLCYFPFFGPVYRALLDYKDDLVWSDWLSNHPFLLILWGSAIILLKICWIWSIAPFGLRFSNLTNRGIITDGAFSLTKHPSYISKNLFWWLIHIPFISLAGTVDGLTNCLQLLTVNAIYFIRAKYEESHLSEEPRYVAYALWIEEHGLFRKIGRWVPGLRFQPAHQPVSAQSG